jgi:hypothetical protein
MSKEKYGFVYIWYDRKHKRYYIGCRWGNVDDGYVCSSPWMKQSYGHRPHDFKRRILKTNIPTREKTYIEEQRWLNMINSDEIKPSSDKPRYYNLCVTNNKVWHSYDNNIKTVGQKISQSKKGKKIGRMCEERKRKISEAKKKAFAERGGMSEEHKQKLRNAKLGSERSTHAKQKTSEALIQKWETDWADRKKKHVIKMTREQQDKLCSEQLKNRWADPEWAARQKEKLSQGAQKRLNKNKYQKS